MKSVCKILCAILLSVSSLFTVSAQNSHYEGNIFLGGKAGATVSRTFFYPSVKQSMKIGGMMGFTFRYIEENHFGLIAELNWEQRGWKENFEESPYRYSRTLNYLQIPVLAHIYFGSPRVHFFVNVGPEIGFMVGESTLANFSPEAINTLPDFPVYDRHIDQLTLSATPKIDFGISGGLGAEYFINGKNSVTAEARFYYGLGNVIECGRTQTFSSANSMSIMVSLGYLFRMK